MKNPEYNYDKLILFFCKMPVIFKSVIQSGILHGIICFTRFSAFYLRTMQTSKTKKEGLI